MKATIVSAEPAWDEWRRVWTLECTTSGAFRSKTLLTPKMWKKLLPQLRGEVRHPPTSERDAKFAAFTVNGLVERGHRIAIETDQNINVKNWGWKERGDDKPTKGERTMAKSVEKREFELDVTVEPGDLSHAQCLWGLWRLARALQQGIVPTDKAHMGVLLGLRKEGSELRKRKVRIRKEDGTEELVMQDYDHPFFKELVPQNGPIEDPLPFEEGESEANGFKFDERVRATFEKGSMTNGLPFAVSELTEKSIKVVFAKNIDVEQAGAYLQHFCRWIPWVDEPKGLKVKKELFSGDN